LDKNYDAEQLVSDGTTTVWTVTYGGQRYEIKLAPGANVSALDKLYHTFSTLRKLSPERSQWHLWQSDGTYRDFTIKGSANAVRELTPLIVAMFVPPPERVDGKLEISPDTLLVKTEWTTENQSELTKLYASGKYIREVDGVIKEEMQLPAKQVLNILNAIQIINWENVPTIIDTTT
jgi:hypothetical protein